jgi:hypothetical protein
VFRDPRYLGGWQIAGIVNEKIAGQFGNVRRVRFDASGQNIQISTLKNFSIALLSSGGVDRNSGQFIGRPPQRAGKSGQDNDEGRSDKTFILVSNVRDPSDTDESGSVEGGAVFFGFLGFALSPAFSAIGWQVSKDEITPSKSAIKARTISTLANIVLAISKSASANRHAKEVGDFRGYYSGTETPRRTVASICGLPCDNCP